MANEGIPLTGRVTDVYPGRKFKVQADLENGSTMSVMCTVSGKLSTNSIKVLNGDRVDIEVSPYDVTKGRIVWRYKN